MSVRQIIEQGINSPNDKSFWERLQDSLPNDSALGIIVRVIGLATLSLVIILTINVIGTRLKRGYKRRKNELVVSVSKSIDDVEIISEEVEEEEIELEVQIEPLIEQKDEQIVLE